LTEEEQEAYDKMNLNCYRFGDYNDFIIRNYEHYHPYDDGFDSVSDSCFFGHHNIHLILLKYIRQFRIADNLNSPTKLPITYTETSPRTLYQEYVDNPDSEHIRQCKNHHNWDFIPFKIEMDYYSDRNISESKMYFEIGSSVFAKMYFCIYIPKTDISKYSTFKAVKIEE